MLLVRRLTLFDAVAIGLGAMLGAGVFAVWGPAISSAGTALAPALALAAAVALANATSTARLAAVHPVSGGAYAYGRAELGAWPGYLAGWCFVVGKLASCAAMAMTFASYAAPAEWRIPVAVAAVVALTAVTCAGATRTARATQALVVITLLGLGAVFAAASSALPSASPAPLPDAGLLGTLQGAGLLFFAFAGYARIATLGEEVRDPARTIPRAVPIALAAALVVYALIGGAVVLVLGGDAIGSASPLADLVARAGWGGAEPVARIAAATASLGALLALLSGIGRTALAMAREHDLPTALAAVDDRRHVPLRAQLAAGGVVVAIVLLVDVRGAIGFSSFGVLLYYLVANAAAFAMDRRAGRARRWSAAIGAAGCAVLAFTLPLPSVLAGAGVAAAGLVVRAIRLRISRGRSRTTP